MTHNGHESEPEHGSHDMPLDEPAESHGLAYWAGYVLCIAVLVFALSGVVGAMVAANVWVWRQVF